jgi:L-amino acid N-acyltransferase YncA
VKQAVRDKHAGSGVRVRPASEADVDAIRAIYNEGIQDRVATLDDESKSESDMRAWWADHAEPHAVLVATTPDERIVGWASLNRFSHRCAHAEIADLSVYVARDSRGRGIGTALLCEIERAGVHNGFHKIVLHALARNLAGKALYESSGFRMVGVLREHGKLDTQYLDVIVMEKILAR